MIECTESMPEILTVLWSIIIVGFIAWIVTNSIGRAIFKASEDSRLYFKNDKTLAGIAFVVVFTIIFLVSYTIYHFVKCLV